MPFKKMSVEMDLGLPLHSQDKFLLILLLQHNLSKSKPQINSLDETNSWYWPV